MEAVKYLKTMERICRTYETCDDCPLCNALCLASISNCMEAEEIKESVRIVKQWDKEHASDVKE